jgi:hypothetical protein
MRISGQEIYYDDLPESAELEANLDYVLKRSDALGVLFDALETFKPHLETFNISPVKFHALYEHVASEMIISDTDLQIARNDYSRSKANKSKESKA